MNLFEVEQNNILGGWGKKIERGWIILESLSELIDLNGLLHDIA